MRLVRHWPIAVLPGHQGRGTGSALIREGLSPLGAMDSQGCVVLGFWTRFGFNFVPTPRLDGVPPEYFTRLRIAGPPQQGSVSYHPAVFAA